MAKIAVEKGYSDEFRVTVAEENSETLHIVSLPEEYYLSLCGGKISKEELIKRAFKFLLTKEPKEMIMNSFELSKINQFFPEFEEEIIKRR